MPLKMKYFVLKPQGDTAHASASRRAMRAYAESIESFDPVLSKSLHKWADKELELAAARPKRKKISQEDDHAV